MNNGSLNLISKLFLSISPTHLSLDRQGQYLFCSSYNHSCISISAIDENGVPQLPKQIINNLEGCHSANIDLNNEILFVPALKQDKIYIFQFHENGTISPYDKKNQVNTFNKSGPRHMDFHPNGKYAYCINELSGIVDVLKLDSREQQIKYKHSFNIMPKEHENKSCWASDIHITPNGSFLYTCERNSNIVTIFSTKEHGATLSIEGFQTTEKQPRGFNIDHNGNYLIVAGQKSNHISIYKIKNNGLLNLITRFPVGKGPMWVAVTKLHAS